MPLNILVIGATGVIGAPITNAILSAKASFGRIAILTSSTTVTNKASQIDSLKSQGAEILTGDLSNEQDVKRAYNGAPPSLRTPLGITMTNAATLQIST
jgi:nucleoside-diphosphate-sugar epimerase